MRTILFIGGVILCSFGFGQLSHGGQPQQWGVLTEMRSDVPSILVVGMDPAEQAALLPVEGEFRYGVQREVMVDVTQAGSWNTLPSGDRMCQVVLHSPGAVMLGVQFDRWRLPVGAQVFLYNAERTYFIGAFDGSNASPLGTMATSLIPGDRVVIEYLVPGGVPLGALRVSSITHGLVDVLRFGEAGLLRDIDPGYQSAPCHNNVVCPAAAAWQDQKRAVALFLRPDGNGCTGSLINNTQTPGRPYFYLANHCYQPNVDQWVFYFNYDSPTCVGSTGPTTQTLTGGVRRSAYYYDDFCLVELFDTPPASYGVYYAGWDRSGAQPLNQTVIHHPLYDVKKITFDNDPATSYADAEGIQMWRNYWDNGIVEAVSSGSPLFDHNKRIIGHMTEGAQTCANVGTVFTGCAKFSESWDGTAATSRLRDWLDPANTTAQLDGYDPNFTPSVVRVSVRSFLSGPYDIGTGRMSSTLNTLGLIPLQEPYTEGGFVQVGGGGETTTGQVLSIAGANAIVDWVVVDLRSAVTPAIVSATRCALVQADGDIVAVDGVSPVEFSMPAGNYRIGVHHRNHLSVVTAQPIALSAMATSIDISNGSAEVVGGSLATDLLDGRRVLVPGDALRDGVIRYAGASNDRDAVLSRIGGGVPTATVPGYFSEDVNMDGLVRYTGASNDRDIILQSIGGSVPTNTRSAQVP